jgi:hypothetical protein
VPGKAARVGISALVAQDVDEHAIAAFGMKPINRRIEYLLVIHPPLLFLREALHAPGGPFCPAIDLALQAVHAP